MNIDTKNIKYVVCNICLQEMVPEKVLATVYYIYGKDSVTPLCKYVCHTPDCGNEVVVETK